MRRLLVWVPEGEAGAVREHARRNGANQAQRVAADADSGPMDLLTLQVANERVGDPVDDLNALDGLLAASLS